MECFSKTFRILITKRKSAHEGPAPCSSRRKMGSPLIVAEDVEGEPCPRGDKLAERSAPRQGPWLGTPKAMLEDIATLTGKPSRRLGIKLENVKLGGPRPAKKITIRQGQHHNHRRRREVRDIEGRVKQIRSRLKTPPATMTRKSSRNASKLVGGVAVIKSAQPRDRLKEKKGAC